MPTYRFTINLTLSDPSSEDDFEEFAGMLLDEMLARQSKGVYSSASVTGRVDERRLRLQIEFESEAYNKAHTDGVAHIEDTLYGVGVVLITEPPTLAVTEDHEGDDFDTKVEELRGHHPRRAMPGKSELVPA